MRTATLSTLLAAGALAAPTSLKARDADPRGNCFPFGDQTLNSDFSAPSVPRDQWFCSSDAEYGFLGFSYPLEVDDCSDYSNSFDSINADFAEMRNNFGAKYVRVYYPACTESSVFENLLKAGVANNMAVIPQVWFNFGDDDDGSIWKASRDAIVSVFNNDQYKAIAPYVFHSVDFGSEPVGDGVDGGNDQFVADLADFKNTINGFGVPAGFSDDWDREALLDGDSFTDIGQKALDASDYIHMHPLAFYNMNNAPESDAWGYIQEQVERMNRIQDEPIIITESPWAWGETDHYGGHVDTTDAAYADFWNTFNDNCQYFKDQKVGWFLHAFNNEGTFSMKKDDGSYEIDPWFGKTC